jgi:hypothetical protein
VSPLFVFCAGGRSQVIGEDGHNSLPINDCGKTHQRVSICARIRHGRFGSFLIQHQGVFYFRT